MKRVYWRPRKISKVALFVIGLVAVGGTLVIESFSPTRPAPQQPLKLAAAERAAEAMQSIRDKRLAMGHLFDKRFDPGQTGIVGEAMSLVTSLPSHLETKQTSVNPNYAAAVVEMLAEANVQPGDTVAVGYTGSFPALNVCVCAAIEEMQLQPIIVHSAASSQFGANHPEMMWLDMERRLVDRGIISFRSQAATLGGFGDRARGMSAEAQAALLASLERNDIPLLKISRLRESIEQRMAFYTEQAAGKPIAAYLNVGGGAASIHGADGREAFGSGLTVDSEEELIGDDLDAIDCVATRFHEQGVPVIHLGNVLTLAKQYGLPIAPREMPEVGTGPLFTRTAPSRLWAGLLLLSVLTMIRVYVWSDLWLRLKQTVGQKFGRRTNATEGLTTATAPAELAV